jgi:hypothetical protein
MYPDEIAACNDGPEKGVCPLCKRIVNGARLDGIWLPKRGDDYHARSCPNALDTARANDNAPAELAADVLMERDTYRRALEDVREDAQLLMPHATAAKLQDAVWGIRTVADNALNAYPKKSDGDGK